MDTGDATFRPAPLNAAQQEVLDLLGRGLRRAPDLRPGPAGRAPRDAHRRACGRRPLPSEQREPLGRQARPVERARLRGQAARRRRAPVRVERAHRSGHRRPQGHRAQRQLAGRGESRCNSSTKPSRASSARATSAVAGSRLAARPPAPRYARRPTTASPNSSSASHHSRRRGGPSPRAAAGSSCTTGASCSPARSTSRSAKPSAPRAARCSST